MRAILISMYVCWSRVPPLLKKRTSMCICGSHLQCECKCVPQPTNPTCTPRWYGATVILVTMCHVISCQLTVEVPACSEPTNRYDFKPAFSMIATQHETQTCAANSGLRDCTIMSAGTAATPHHHAFGRCAWPRGGPTRDPRKQSWKQMHVPTTVPRFIVIHNCSALSCCSKQGCPSLEDMSCQLQPHVILAPTQPGMIQHRYQLAHMRACGCVTDPANHMISSYHAWS